MPRFSLLFSVNLINLLFYLFFNLISFNTSIECTNFEISSNETFQVLDDDKNISIEINYTEIFDDNEEFVVVEFNATLKNDTFFDGDDIDEEIIVVGKTVRKCCGINEIYAFSDKVCRVSENVKELLGKFKNEYNRTLITSHNNFQLCEGNDVIIEYDWIPFRGITFNEDVLSVEGQKDSLTTFCIDFNRDLEQMGTKLTVRTCVSKLICDSIPCVRKCCKGGEKLQLKNEISSCVPFNGNIAPSFYKIQNWQTKNEALLQRDMKGMINVMTTVKYDE